MCPETRKSPVRVLKERRRIWESKEIIRKLYTKWYETIKEALKPGRTLELGGGSGNLKEFLPEAITSDIVFAPWLNAVMDAHGLPFRDESLDNVVLFDVLHHLAAPAAFFREMERVLRPGGRVVMMEPYVSWLSFPVYRFLHAEGMRWQIDPFKETAWESKEPFEGNQAVPTLIFGKHRAKFNKSFPRLKITREAKMDILVYPMSGGFHHPGFCPIFLWRVFEVGEHLLKPFRKYLAFRLFLVLEKQRSPVY
jgi:SAM-dependent methyltransferase